MNETSLPKLKIVSSTSQRKETGSGCRLIEREDGDDILPVSEVWLRPLGAGGFDGRTLTGLFTMQQSLRLTVGKSAKK